MTEPRFISKLERDVRTILKAYCHSESSQHRDEATNYLLKLIEKARQEQREEDARIAEMANPSAKAEEILRCNKGGKVPYIDSTTMNGWDMACVEISAAIRNGDMP